MQDQETTLPEAVVLEETVAVAPTPVKKTRKKKEKVEKGPTENSLIAAALEAAPAKKKKYLNNADLLKQLALSREQDKMTDELAKMLTMLCARYAKHPDYSNIFSYDEDMKSFAMLTGVKVWRSFNPEKSNNPFAYFTQIFRHAFYQYLNHETKQRVIKDEILVNIGELPSYTYMENFAEERDAERWGDDGDDEGEGRSGYRGYGDDPTAPSQVREIDYTKGAINDDSLDISDNGDINDL